MERSSRRLSGNSIRFWLLAAYLLLVFLLGGGARGDIQSLLILRPIAILVCGFALLTLTREQIREYRFLLVCMAAMFLLVASHLLPLPPVVWGSLPGRQIITEIDTATGIGAVWRPLSIAPLATWNALYSLFVPLAALLLVVQLTRREQYNLLPWILILGLASGMTGLLQVIGPDKGPLYLYRITNPGHAVGFFANRNHQALFLACLLPMLAVYASADAKTLEKARIRAGLAFAAGLVLVPLLLVTGSRAGLAIGLLGLASSPFLYRKPTIENVPRRRHTRSSLIPALVGGVSVVGLVLLSVLLSRAEAFSRMIAPDALEDMRFRVWGPIARMGGDYFPVGSGVGTFEEAYKIHEPDRLLQTTYLNHAHNDWLEIYATTGLFGPLLLLVAVAAFLFCCIRIWRSDTTQPREKAYGKLGAILVLLLGLASVADYPARVPSIACLAVIFVIWMVGGARNGSRSV